MSDETDPMLMLSFFIIIGVPMLFAYLSTGNLKWAVHIGTFTCAWWVAWEIMVNGNE